MTAVMSKVAQTVERKTDRILAMPARRAFIRAGILFEWFSVTALLLGLFWGSSADFRIAMKTGTCVALLAVVM